MSATELTCRQPGCGGPPSGVCIENFTFEECPYLKPAPTEARDLTEDDSTGPEPETVPDLVRTGNESQLDAAGCDALLRARSAIVVGLVAAPEVGKTTLMSTLYELLRRGKLTGYGFAGSETIRGLEERCFLSRAKSENVKPDTLHTSARAGLNFTHLTVATTDGRKELVISDRSGEHFQRVLDTPGAIAEFVELDRANVTLLLVDGEQLVLAPHRPRAEARRLFMALQQAGFADRRQILVVATKRDRLPDERLLELDEALADLVADLEQRAPGTLLQAHATGARPRQGPDFGEGFETLIGALLPEPPEQSFNTWIPAYDGESALERLIDPLERQR